MPARSIWAVLAPRWVRGQVGKIPRKRGFSAGVAEGSQHMVRLYPNIPNIFAAKGSVWLLYKRLRFRRFGFRLRVSFFGHHDQKPYGVVNSTERDFAVEGPTPFPVKLGFINDTYYCEYTHINLYVGGG